MNENNIPDFKAQDEIHPNGRDLGFVLLGIALGIIVGSALSLCSSPQLFLLPLLLVLSMMGTYLIRKFHSR